MDTIADYMTADTKLPPYLPYPRFLMEADLTQFAKLLYSVLLDRANLSLANGWQDDEGQIYIVFPVCKIANAVDRSPMTVKNALTELETVGLIERRRQGFSQPNRIYVKIPDGQDIVLLTDKKLSHRGKETCPTDGQKAVPMTDRKLSPNNMSNNNLRNSNLSGVRERPPARGRYENVFLTEAEVAELQADFPSVWQEYIERLSEYMASTGKTYKSHAATIRRWAKEDRRKGKGFTDPAMRTWTFANDNGKCPQMKHVHFTLKTGRPCRRKTLAICCGAAWGLAKVTSPVASPTL